MKKLFISQPMKDKTESEIMAERADAIRAAVDAMGEPVEVIDTYFGDFDGKALEFLGKSIMLLATADIAYFARGWDRILTHKQRSACAAAGGFEPFPPQLPLPGQGYGGTP